ncbi:MAG: deoxyribonuclease IV [Chloroflexota bacterium]|nr:deoxyribonuclease IV [Chloroflexota bacterium]
MSQMTEQLSTAQQGPDNQTSRIGAHLSGGVKGALDHARRMGLGRSGEVGGEGGPIQLWSRNPSAWRSVSHLPQDVTRFREGCAVLDLSPVFIHGIYLMNFAAADDALWERSVEALADHLRVGATLGAKAVILHPGAAGGQAREQAIDRCALAIRRALEQTDAVADRPLVALETCAGAGSTLGRTFGELAAVLERLDGDASVAVALDTAHLWGSGYDLASAAGLAATMAELEATLPLERIIAIHANDSKVPLGSHKDRHENIGEGYIGEAGFSRLLAHPAWRRWPWIMEVPGYDGTGPDAANLATLRRLAAPAPEGSTSHQKDVRIAISGNVAVPL